MGYDFVGVVSNAMFREWVWLQHCVRGVVVQCNVGICNGVTGRDVMVQW